MCVYCLVCRRLLGDFFKLKRGLGRRRGRDARGRKVVPVAFLMLVLVLRVLVLVWNDDIGAVVVVASVGCHFLVVASTKHAALPPPS